MPSLPASPRADGSPGSAAPQIVLVMGVAGSGKTTVGQQLAADLSWEFRDADAFHPPANIAKMRAGNPLTDADRAPWLAAIRQFIDACLANGTHAVITCSALRASYRQVLLEGTSGVGLVHLVGDPAVIAQRLATRAGHFMPASLLPSQLATLEPPVDALTVDIALSPAAIVAKIRHAFSL